MTRSRITDGWLLIGCGLLHTLVGVALGWDDLVGIARGGFWNTIYGADPGEVSSYADVVDGFRFMGGSRPRTFWFLQTGLPWIVLGALAHWIERTVGRPLPRFVGIAMLAYALVGFVLDPMSGFSILSACCVVIIVRGYRPPRAM